MDDFEGWPRIELFSRTKEAHFTAQVQCSMTLLHLGVRMSRETHFVESVATCLTLLRTFFRASVALFCFFPMLTTCFWCSMAGIKHNSQAHGGR